MLSNLTFVTLFIDIYKNNPFENKDLNWRIKNFENMAKTGIQICLYIDESSKSTIDTLCIRYPNIRLLKILDITDTWVYKLYKESEDYSLPDTRNSKKDTLEYICIQNSKIEFVRDAISQNPFNSSHFAWIDFSIFYIFKEPEKTSEYLRTLSYRSLKPNFLMIPGYWNKLTDINHILNDIHWRFCGGFFIGDKNSILEFHNYYLDYFPVFLKKYKKIIWEVNFWAWLEANTNWSPMWFYGVHNDTMLDLESNILSICVLDNATSRVYDYVTIDKYKPSSAAYIFHKNKHILNTRYVNYIMMKTGKYIIQDDNNIIRTKNILSILDDDFRPTNYLEMNEEHIGLASKNGWIYGLEDIRLYECNGKIHYIATSVNYSPNYWNLMISGIYDIDNLEYKESRVLYPPYETSCEKNWIPLIKKGENEFDEEFFIYKWSPLEIGKINNQTNKIKS